MLSSTGPGEWVLGGVRQGPDWSKLTGFCPGRRGRQDTQNNRFSISRAGHGQAMAAQWPGHDRAMDPAMAGPRPGTPYWIWKAFCFRHDMALELVCGAAGQVQKPLIEIRR